MQMAVKLVSKRETRGSWRVCNRKFLEKQLVGERTGERVEQSADLECVTVPSKIWAPDKDSIQGTTRIRNLQRPQNPFPVNIKGPLNICLQPEKLLRSETA